jgi:hypothetical protein
MSKKEQGNIFYLFLAWLFSLSLIVFLAPFFLTYQASFPYAPELSRYGLPDLLSKLANFDGVHYLTISEKGYLGTGLIQAFFPLYPLLIKLFNSIFNNYLVTGLVLSHLFALTSFYAFYALVKLDFGQKIAWWSLIFLAFFVSSFYLRSFYNESLFLTLLLTSFWAGKKRYYWLAGILGLLLSATRVVGIFILPSLWLMIYLGDRQNYQAYFKVSLSALGLLAYMLYLKWQFGDFLYFFTLQEQFGASRQSSLVSYPQVIYRYLKIFYTGRPIDLKYYAYVQEFLLSISRLVLLLLATWQSWKQKAYQALPYLLFALLAYFLPTLTGNLSSMPRYLLLCFPLFIYLASWMTRVKPVYRFLYLTISLIFLIINLILFSQGYWVA